MDSGLDHLYKLISYSLYHCQAILKISSKSVNNFWVILLTDWQTNSVKNTTPLQMYKFFMVPLAPVNQSQTLLFKPGASLREPCDADEFTCDNFVCVSKEEDLCDGIDDCGDGSDEKACREYRFMVSIVTFHFLVLSLGFKDLKILWWEILMTIRYCYRLKAGANNYG